MNPEFIDWIADLKPSQWCMYANAFADEEGNSAYGYGFRDGQATCHDMSIVEPTNPQTFQDWLLDCFNREHGEKIQGEDNESK